MRKIPVTIPFFSEDELVLVKDTLDSGWVAQGRKVIDFETLVAQHEGVKYGIATTSCTTALHLALLGMGIGKGDDVLVPSFTFVATPNSVLYTGATPVFVDIKSDTTYNMDPESIRWVINENYYLDKEGVFRNKTTKNKLKAVIVVHEFGLCAEMESICEIAKENNLLILEDSACALGASINGTHQSGFGIAGCVSFHPRKSITTGEGGMVLTSEKVIEEKVRKLRSHGASVSEIQRHQSRGFLLPDYDELGYNFRMTDVQGALGIAQVRKLDWMIEEKRKRAKYYNGILQQSCPWLTIPAEPEGYFHPYQSYVCMVDLEALALSNIEEGHRFRNSLMEYLENNGVATRQGTHATHILGQYRRKCGYKPEDYPNSYKADRLSIALPLYVQISQEDQQYVIEQIKKGITSIGV